MTATQQLTTPLLQQQVLPASASAAWARLGDKRTPLAEWQMTDSYMEWGEEWGIETNVSILTHFPVPTPHDDIHYQTNDRPWRPTRTYIGVRLVIVRVGATLQHYARLNSYASSMTIINFLQYTGQNRLPRILPSLQLRATFNNKNIHTTIILMPVFSTDVSILTILPIITSLKCQCKP